MIQKQYSYSDNGTAFNLESTLHRINVLGSRISASTIGRPGNLEIEIIRQSINEIKALSNIENPEMPKLYKLIKKKAKQEQKKVNTYEKKLLRNIDRQYWRINTQLQLSRLPAISYKARERKFRQMQLDWDYFETLRVRLTKTNPYLDSGIRIGMSETVNDSIIKHEKRTRMYKKAAITAIVLGVLAETPNLMEHYFASRDTKTENTEVMTPSSPPAATRYTGPPLLESKVKKLSREDKQQEFFYNKTARLFDSATNQLKQYEGRKLSIEEFKKYYSLQIKLRVCRDMLSVFSYDNLKNEKDSLMQIIEHTIEPLNVNKLSFEEPGLKELFEAMPMAYGLTEVKPMKLIKEYENGPYRTLLQH